MSQSFVGTDGIMLKTTNLDGIKEYDTMEGEGTILKPSSYADIARGMSTTRTTETEEQVRLPKIQIVVATKSAEAGINGKHLVFGKVSGLPASLYELVQQMGRVDRVGTDAAGTNTYEVHLDLNSYVSLIVRIMQCDCESERRVQLRQMHEVLTMLVLPKTCYHVAIERKFEWEWCSTKDECGDYCSKCCNNGNEAKNFTKRVNKRGLQALLADKVRGSEMSVKEFMQTLKKWKATVFHKDDVPGRVVKQVHALALQLIAARIIALKMKTNSKIGTDKARKEDLVVFCPNDSRMNEGEQYCRPGYTVDNLWKGFNLCSEID